jgi:hypothetical protein
MPQCRSSGFWHHATNRESAFKSYQPPLVLEDHAMGVGFSTKLEDAVRDFIAHKPLSREKILNKTIVVF